MTHIVTDLGEAKATLDHFNGFHDGFIKQLSVISHDSFEERHVQSASQRLDLQITFAHHNYQQGNRPANQLITASFYSVMDLFITVSGLLYEWSIYELFIVEATRTLEDGRTEPSLKASLLQSRLIDNQEWQRNEDIKFTFRYAEFDEN